MNSLRIFISSVQKELAAAKTRVLSILMERAKRGENGLSNQEIRQITRFNRHQVKRMLTELRNETAVFISGHGAGARYYWRKP